MTHKHTPGPWKLAWEDGKHGVVASSIPEPNVVALVGNRDDGRNDIRKANARLMAAAPDLLEACEVAERILTEYGIPDERRTEIQSAIAKATGEQP